MAVSQSLSNMDDSKNICHHEIKLCVWLRYILKGYCGNYSEKLYFVYIFLDPIKPYVMTISLLTHNVFKNKDKDHKLSYKVLPLHNFIYSS